MRADPANLSPFQRVVHAIVDDPCPIPTREETTVDKVSIHRLILTWSRPGRETGESGITARFSFLLDGNLRAARVLGPPRIVHPLEKRDRC